MKWRTNDEKLYSVGTRRSTAKKNTKKRLAYQTVYRKRPDRRQIARVYQKEYRRRKPGVYRNSWLRSTYGIGEQDYQRMLHEQYGCCAVCGACDPGRGSHGKSFAVDHVHGAEPVKLRSLLCNNCNLAIGHGKESPHRLRLLATYIESFY